MQVHQFSGKNRTETHVHGHESHNAKKWDLLATCLLLAFTL